MLQLISTADGSNTFFNTEVGEHYHSRHGALQESRHVFLEAGLKYFVEVNNPATEVSILEAGFGTGLNFLLSADYCTGHSINLRYTGIEAYPLTADQAKATGYDAYISANTWEEFCTHYSTSLKEAVKIGPLCELKIPHCTFADFTSGSDYDILYFDAFAAAHQPELWTYDAIAHLCRFIRPGGVFVTYAITGNLKRTLKTLGFTIEKLPGAPGKREMLRAVKQ